MAIVVVPVVVGIPKEVHPDRHHDPSQFWIVEHSFHPGLDPWIHLAIS